MRADGRGFHQATDDPGDILPAVKLESTVCECKCLGVFLYVSLLVCLSAWLCVCIYVW